MFRRNSSGQTSYIIEGQTEANAHLWGISKTGLFDGSMAITGVTGLASGIATFLAAPSSANLLATMTDKTGTGLLVFNNTPTFITPVLGVATATSINKITLTQPATGATLTIPDGVTMTGPSASATVATLSLTNTLTGRQDASGAASTAPLKVGTSLPGTCTVGDLYFKSDATAGQNQYNCTATNTWTQNLNSGGGSTTAASINTALSVTDSGTVNALAGSDANSTAATDGLLVVVKPKFDNTTGATFALSGGAAKPIQTAYGAALVAGAIRADGAASPSGILLRYSSAANGGSGAWQDMTLEQVQLSPQTTVNANMGAIASGAGLTQWAYPGDPGWRRTALMLCDGRHWDIPFNSPGYGAAWEYGTATGTVTGSASTGSGTQSPGCTLTTSASSGDNVYYNTTDDKIFAVGRNNVFDVKLSLSAITSTRNWIGFTGGATSAIVASATPSTSGFFGFRLDTGAGDTSWHCIVAAAAATNIDSGVAPSTNQVKLKAIEDSLNGAVHFFIDDTEVCLATAVTNMPTGFLSFVMTETTLTTATRALTMNWAWIQGDK